MDVIARYRGDPADATYFSTHPYVVVQLNPGFFRFGFEGNIDFELPDCEGEIYISNPTIEAFDLLRIEVTNDPVVGAVAYVPTIPITSTGIVSRLSRLQDGGGCVNISTNDNGVFAKPVELGFFPPYSVTN